MKRTHDALRAKSRTPQAPRPLTPGELAGVAGGGETDNGTRSGTSRGGGSVTGGGFFEIGDEGA